MNTTTPDLDALLAAETSSRGRVDVLNAASRELSFKEPERALELARQARKLAEQGESGQPYAAGLAAALFNLARASNQLGNYPQSLECLLEALPLYENLQDDEGLMWCYNEFGRTHHFLSDYSTALENYLKGLQLADKIGHSNRQAGLRHNIAMLYTSTGQVQAAIEIALQGLGIAEAAGDTSTQAFLLGGLAENYFHLKQIPLALEYGRRALKMARTLSLPGLLHGTLLAVSWACFESGDTAAAQGALEDAQASAQQSNDKRGYGEVLRARGEQACRLGNATGAIALLQQALGVAEEIQEKAFMASCCQSLSQAYAATGAFEDALRAHQKFHELDKTVFNEKSDQRLKSLAIIHQLETARHEAEIYQLRNITLQNEIAERARAQEALQHLADHDPLTGLWNRRVFFERGEVTFAQAGLPVALIMLDLDHFKAVNDRFGHQAGDQVLIALAGIIHKHVRDLDIVCRYGGEEIALLLPGSKEIDAGRIAERLRQAVEGHVFNSEAGQVQVTISLGVAERLAQPCAAFADLLHAADHALYTAKSYGRNCVILSSHLNRGRSTDDV